MNENREIRKEQLPWEQAATFEGKGFVVIISAQYGQGRPRYSLEIGRRAKDDPNKILHHIGILVDDSKLVEHSPEIEFLNDPLELANLIEDAGNWIRDQLERSRKEWINRKQTA